MNGNVEAGSGPLLPEGDEKYHPPVFSPEQSLLQEASATSVEAYRAAAHQLWRAASTAIIRVSAAAAQSGRQAYVELMGERHSQHEARVKLLSYLRSLVMGVMYDDTSQLLNSLTPTTFRLPIARSLARVPAEERPGFGMPEVSASGMTTRSLAPLIDKDLNIFTWEVSRTEGIENTPYLEVMPIQGRISTALVNDIMNKFGLGRVRHYLTALLDTGIHISEKTASGQIIDGYTIFLLPDFFDKNPPRNVTDQQYRREVLVVCDGGDYEAYNCSSATALGKKGTVRKPVIYLYGQKTEHVITVQAKAGKIAYEYPPAVDHSWHVTANTDGMVTIGANTYPYLFWEMELDKPLEEPFTEGFCVAGPNTRDFLEKTLTKLNLTVREKTDFITYWYPELAKNTFNKILFAVDSECDKFAELVVEPAPAHVHRLYMLYQPVESLVALMPQDLQPFARKLSSECFEWGGARV